MDIFFIGLGTFFIIISLLPFIKIDYWLVRVFDYPRFQIFSLGLVSLGGFIYFEHVDIAWEYFFIMSLSVCLIYQFAVIIPYTPVYKPQVKDIAGQNKDECISLLIANVLMSNRKTEKLFGLIKNCDPDIILLIETDYWWEEEMDSLKKNYPASLSYPLENTYGMLMYSRLELLESEIRFLVEEDIPSFHACIKLKNGKIVELYGLHPTPPVPGENNRSTERDAELLIVGKEAKKSSRPIIVAGDLNDVAWSYTTKLFQKISGLLDPRVGRGMFNTYNAKYPLLRWPLDHIFHTNHFRVVQLKRLSNFGSDHFPIFINLHLGIAGRNGPKEPTADKEEIAEAEEKIQKA